MLKRRLKEPFGKAGLTVAILALVLAMVGGAYAAGGLTKSQEKQVTKIAKKYAGKTGPAGPAGPAGTNGTNGKDGAAGANGVGVTSTESANAIEGHCTGTGVSTTGKGGSKFVSSSGTTYACNGKEGSPWTAGGTLPHGATETGAWSIRTDGESAPAPPEEGNFPVSFTIPLAAPLESAQSHIVGFQIPEGKIGSGGGEFCEGKTGTELAECEAGAEEIKAACPGSAADPQAQPGQFCLYVGIHSNQTVLTHIIRPSGLELGAATAGAFVPYESHAHGVLAGTWAVTAE